MIHYGPNGPDKCEADPSNPRSTGCKFKDSPHFETMAEAEAAYSEKMSKEHGMFGTVSTRQPLSLADKYENAIKTADNPSAPEIDDYRNKLYQAKSSMNQPGSLVSNSDLVSDLQEPDGGATLNVNSREYISHGFAYSPYPEHSKAVHISEIQQEDVYGYIEDKKDILSQDGHNLGVWHDPETGNVYLDISVVSDDAKEARQGCEENDQIAFFDMQTFTSVDVDRKAKSGGAAEKPKKKRKKLLGSR